MSVNKNLIYEAAMIYFDHDKQMLKSIKICGDSVPVSFPWSEYSTSIPKKLATLKSCLLGFA